MKITYIKPQTDIVELSMESMLLNGSNGENYARQGVATDNNEFTQSAKEHNFDFFEDEE